MKPNLQRVERGAAYYFTVDDEFRCGKPTQGRGEIATKRFAGFCPEVDGLAALEGEAAEAIPFRFGRYHPSSVLRWGRSRPQQTQLSGCADP
ncbi:hypothetical protein [Mesorhizobium sp. 43Arga]